MTVRQALFWYITYDHGTRLETHTTLHLYTLWKLLLEFDEWDGREDFGPEPNIALVPSLFSFFCFLLSVFCFLLSVFCFLLSVSAFCFLLSAFCFLYLFVWHFPCFSLLQPFRTVRNLRVNHRERVI